MHMRKRAELQSQARFLNEDRKMAAAKRRELLAKEGEGERIGAEITECQEKLKPLEEGLREVREVEKNYSGVVAKRQEAM